VLCRAVSGSGLADLGCRRAEDYGLSHERITLAPTGSSCVQDLPGCDDNTDTLLLCLGKFLTQFLGRGQNYRPARIIAYAASYPYMKALLGNLVKMIVLEVF